MLKIKTLIIPVLGTNCYIISKEKECIIFDCGGDDEILKYLKNNELEVKKIFLTHGHYDHISAIQVIREEYKNVEVIAYEKEKIVLEDEKNNLSKEALGIPLLIKDVTYKKDGDIVNALDMDIKIIATPGHTIGGCCYYISSENTLFSGDTLFCGTYGRYDLPTGSVKDLINSIGAKLMELPDETEVYPGHGFRTSIKYERKNNEIVRDYVIEWGKSLQ